MQLSKHLISAVFMALLFAIISIIYYPTSPGGTIYVTASTNITIQWDTGYGFNTVQSNEVMPDCRPQKIGNMSLCKAHDFHYWSQPERIKLVNSQNLDAFVIYKNSPNLNKINLSEEHTASLPAVKKDFNQINLVLFPFGIFLIGLITYFISLNLSLSYQLYKKKLHYFFFTAVFPYLTLSFLMWFIFPGRLNPFNPLDTIHSSAMGYVIFKDSLLLQFLWGSLYSVIESPFFILIFHAMAFLSCLLSLWHKWAEKKVSFVTILLLVFNPISIFYYGFLERSIANAYVFCITVLAIAYFSLHKSNKTVRLLTLSILCIALLMLRMDNIIFIIILILILNWKNKHIYALMIPLILSFTWIYSGFNIKQLIIKNHETVNYINVSLADSIARLYVNADSSELVLKSSENEFFQRSLNFKHFPEKVDWHFDIHKVYPTSDQPIVFLKNALSLISKMPLQFLYIRTLVAKKSISYMGDDGWNTSTLAPNLFDLSFYIGDSKNIGTTKGHKTNTDIFLLKGMHGYILVIIIFTILSMGLILWFKFPLTGKISLLIIVKLIVIGLAIPIVGGRYMYEILLATSTLPMVFWAEKKIIK